MQPYFLPYIGYFQAIDAVDKYILYSNVNFSKHGWINRNRLLIKDGSIHTITVPLIKQSSSTLVKSIKIANNFEWQKKLIKTINQNYKNAKFFDEAYPFFEKLLSNTFDYLYDLNGYFIHEIIDFIGIETTIEYNNIDKYTELEKRLTEIDNNNYSPFKYLQATRPKKKTARIIEICRNENADTYINAIGGVSLYSKKEFSEYGVDLKFIKMKEFDYPQLSKIFEQNLSIIDVLMHNGVEKTKRLIKQYTLI